MSELAPTATQQALFWAVDALLAERGGDSFTMADVAKTAGFSRQTVYNEFSNRQQLIARYITNVTDRFLEELETTLIANSDNPERAIERAFEHFLTLAQNHPLVVAMSMTGTSSDLSVIAVNTAATEVLGQARTTLTRVVMGLWPGLRRRDIEDAIEIIVRLGLTHIFLRVESKADALRQFSTVMSPFLNSVVAPAALSGTGVSSGAAYVGEPSNDRSSDS